MAKTQYKNFFDMSHYLIDFGVWANLSPPAKALYVVLSERGNRYTSIDKKVFFQSDKELLQLTGIKNQKTLTKAKKELKKKRLIDYWKRVNMRTEYVVFLIHPHQNGGKAYFNTIDPRSKRVGFNIRGEYVISDEEDDDWLDMHESDSKSWR